MRIPVLICPLMWLTVTSAAHPPMQRSETCTCEEAKTTNGWCGRCGVGYAASLKIPSALLYEALDMHGHEIKPSSFTCPTCQASLRTNGFCEKCRIGFIGGLAYMTRPAYVLVHGTAVDAEKLTCVACRGHLAQSGWCEDCKIGIVGNLAFSERALLVQAQAAYKRLVKAVAKLNQCEICAIVMAFDGRCAKCNLHYKDGKLYKPRLKTRESPKSATTEGAK
jgi:hypothetical protein